MFHYAANNPVKYTDPDGEYTYDSHNSHRILANLDDRNDLINAAELLVDPNNQYTITAYGETSGITRIFNNYTEIENYLYSEYTGFVKALHKEVGEGGGARALFFDGEFAFKPEDGNLNLNTNFGVATVDVPIMNSLFIKLQGMTASGLLGWEGSRLGFDADVSIVNGAIVYKPTINKLKLQVSLEGIIGYGASCMIGDGFKFGLSIGCGGSITVKIIEED